MTDKVKYWLDLSDYDIETRYPSHKERLLKSLSKEKCQEIIINTKKLQEWIKLKL